MQTRFNYYFKNSYSSLPTLLRTVTPNFSPEEKILINYLVDILSNEFNNKVTKDYLSN